MFQRAMKHGASWMQRHRQNREADIMEWFLLRLVHPVSQLRRQTMDILEADATENVHPTLAQQRELHSRHSALVNRKPWTAGDL